MQSPELLRAALEPMRERPAELIEVIVRQAVALEDLQKQIQQLQDQIRDLNDRNNGLTRKIETLEKSAARQAAPFRIVEKHRSTAPKKPGRPPGHPGTHRSIPDPIDQQISVPLEHCPECGTSLKDQEADCPHCRKAVRSVHPLQVSWPKGPRACNWGRWPWVWRQNSTRNTD